ncbi:MAG: hypothetical protein MUC42_13985 [Bryobacter sp.]|jgi:hypothetical protein|nr:hypothetical protein [Bryobacter sp.]
MLPTFLVPEHVVRGDGEGPVIALDASSGKILQLTLGVTRIIEQESLDLSLWGSPDGENWGEKPLAEFPQKFYCGTYSILADLAASPEVKFVRAKWKVSRWGRGDATPLFGFFVFAEETAVQVAGAGVTAG